MSSWLGHDHQGVGIVFGQFRKMSGLVYSDLSPDSIIDNVDRQFIEIRAGVGGEEAALFAQNLFRMYSGFARSQGWRLETLDSWIG